MFSNIAAQIAQTPPLVEQTPITIAATAASSTAFGTTSNYVRLNCDVTCSIAFGTGPTATAGNMRLPANTTEYFGIVPGQKVSVITNT